MKNKNGDGNKEKEHSGISACRLALYILCGLAIMIFALQIVAFATGTDGDVMRACYTALGAIGGSVTAIMVMKLRSKGVNKNNRGG